MEYFSISPNTDTIPTKQIEIFRELCKTEKNKNVIFSPFALFAGIALCANGAKGETQKELISFLSNSVDSIEHLNKSFKYFQCDESNENLRQANAVMTKLKTLPEFQSICKFFQAPIDQLIKKLQIK